MDSGINAMRRDCSEVGGGGVFQLRRVGDSFSSPKALASTTVSAVMLTMRLTVAEEVRICTGRAAPSRIGPMVMPSPAAVFSRLKAILAASKVGMIRRLASSFKRERGKF